MCADVKRGSDNRPSETSQAIWLMLAVALAVTGWGGLYYLVTHLYPNSWARLAFLGLWGSALAGTSWPALLAIHQRWSRLMSIGRVWRQSGWIALYAIALAWLQMNRVLTWALAATLAAMAGLFELLLILHERENVRNDQEKTA